MSATALSRHPTLCQLAIGASRISIRHGHTRPRYREPQPELTGYPPGHGENIWIFNNVRSKQVVYSHSPVLDVYKAFRQLPFAGKKTKPSKIRKDLWRHLALVQFPDGMGAVGQSVFAKLREFRRRHELEWDDSLFFAPREDGNGQRVLSRRERGLKIHEQKANAVADLAAVLAGAGKSNKMWLENVEGGEAVKGAVESEKGRLCPATVYWANGIDRHHATEWSPNVKHGLLPNGVDWSVEEIPETMEVLSMEELTARLKRHQLAEQAEA